MKKILSIVLVSVLVLSMFAGCNSKPKEAEDITKVNFKALKKQELGAMMPNLIFAHDGKVAFWGEFGLFVVNGDDGSIYRSVNLEKIGFNHMGGEITTTFAVSPNYKTIYFFNLDAEGNNIEKHYYLYNIEEGVVRQAPIEDNVEILDDPTQLSLKDFGGKEKEPGYTTNLLMYDDNTVVYLAAADWNVKDIEMVFYNHGTEEYTRYKIFE